MKVAQCDHIPLARVEARVGAHVGLVRVRVGPGWFVMWWNIVFGPFP